MAMKNVYFTQTELASGTIEALEAIEPMIDRIDLTDAQAYERAMQPFSRELRRLFAVELYLSEVYNGGHEQFFYNSSGVAWRDVLDGLKAMGAKKAAKLLKSAAEKWAGPIPDEEETRRAALEKMPEGLFDELDDAFYELPEDLSEMADLYLQKYADACVLIRQEPKPTMEIASGHYQALFYQSGYYLPVNREDLDYVAEMRENGEPASIQAIELTEQSDVQGEAYELGVCMAPYFISTYLSQPQTLVMENVQEAYPVEVELLTQQEYNDRLRAVVTAHCSGCGGFGGLTESDSSLSGHFSEISLDNVCLYRWETRGAPRCFYGELLSFASTWNCYGYASRDAEEVADQIRSSMNMRYSSAAVLEEKEKRTLVLQAKKPSILLTGLTDLLAQCVTEWEENYAIRLSPRAECCEETAEAALTPERLAATRKEFKKYGVAVAVLEYAPEYDDRMTAFVNGMAEDALAWPLASTSGKIYCLLTAEGNALVRMRYHTPLLEPCGLSVTVYDALKTVRYQIGFAMTETVLEQAEPEAPKKKKTGSPLRKTEEGKVLNREQAQALLSYLSARLNSEGCDHTLRFTRMWLRETLPEKQLQPALKEICDMGGGCDCEVLMNAYPDDEPSE